MEKLEKNEGKCKRGLEELPMQENHIERPLI